MFGHRTFLMIGDTSAADIISLIKGGPEVIDCNFDFHQNVDNKGKATTRTQSGTLNLTISQLPPQNIIEWALNSRKYTDGVVVVLDAENIPLEKIFFKNATCVNMEINYTQKGESYASTKLIIQAERLTVGDGINFDNEWIQQ